MFFTRQTPTAIPGFGLTMGITLTYLCLVVLIPLSMLYGKAASLDWEVFLKCVASPRAVAAFKLSFGAAAIAAGVNVVLGTLTAWVLVRYPFPLRGLVDALVDLPFALPTAVAGISLTSIYAPNGWLGRYFHAMGIQTAYSSLGIVIALIFIGLPFVVRTIQPVLKDLDPGIEEAAKSLGANRFQVFYRVLLPLILPAAITGFTLAFARALGEYGSVVFISGNMPMRTEILPLLVMTKLEEYRYGEAAALAVVTLSLSFAILLCVNLLQWRSRRHQDANS